MMDIDVNRTMGRFLKISYLNQKGGFIVVVMTDSNKNFKEIFY